MGPEEIKSFQQRRAAIFLDRDGVLVRDRGIVDHFGGFELLPDVQESLVTLKRRGFVLCCVTNQSVVARGRLSLRQLDVLHERLNRHLNPAQPPIDRFFVCPHHPHAQVSEFRQNCACRKPKPGLLIQAAHELNIDLANSVMIGDRLSDIAAGNHVGATTILMASGCHEDPPIVGAEGLENTQPSAQVRNWPQAVAWIDRKIQSDITVGKLGALVTEYPNSKREERR